MKENCSIKQIPDKSSSFLNESKEKIPHATKFKRTNLVFTSFKNLIQNLADEWKVWQSSIPCKVSWRQIPLS
jgi:hypothetical protein